MKFLRLTEVCSSSFLESPFFFLGSLSFLDIELDVAFLKGSLPPELLPYLVGLEDMILWSYDIVLRVQAILEDLVVRCCIQPCFLERRGHNGALYDFSAS